jgi:hypothetical protein
MADPDGQVRSGAQKGLIFRDTRLIGAWEPDPDGENRDRLNGGAIEVRPMLPRAEKALGLPVALDIEGAARQGSAARTTFIGGFAICVAISDDPFALAKVGDHNNVRVWR